MHTIQKELASPKIDEAFLRRSAGETYFERGRRYFTDGCVSEFIAKPDSVSAVVQGTDEYKVGLWREDDSFAYECDCPLGLDGEFCKHCVAVGLAWIAANKSRRTGAKEKVKSSPLEKYLMSLDTAELIKMVIEQAAADKPFAQRLKMRMAKQKAGSQGHQAVVDSFSKLLESAIKRRGYIEYGRVRTYARQIERVAETIAGLLPDGHGAAVRELAEYALDLLEEAFNSVDDSSGYISELAQTFQDLHFKACKAAPPDPAELAEMLFEKEMSSHRDTFHGATQTYAGLLGEAGIAAYKTLAEREWDKLPVLYMSGPGRTYDGKRSAITGIMEQLASVTGDIEAVVAVRKKDLSSSSAYWNIAMIYSKAGEDDKAIEWAERGSRASPRADAQINRFLTEAYQKQGRHSEAIAIAWEAFRAWPCADTYKELKRCVDFIGEWVAWREKAIEWIRSGGHKNRNAPHEPMETSVLVDIFLLENNVEEAWRVAVQGRCYENQWMKLAELRETSHPLESLGVYRRFLEPAIHLSNYQEAVRLLTKIERLNSILDGKDFSALLQSVRVQHKQKRKLMAMLLDKGW